MCGIAIYPRTRPMKLLIPAIPLPRNTNRNPGAAHPVSKGEWPV